MAARASSPWNRTAFAWVARTALACLALVVVAACSSDPGSGSSTSSDAIGADGAGVDGGTVTGKPLSLLFATPARGPLAGGNQVDLQGAGFAVDSLVTIGGSPAEVTFRAGTTHLFVTVPAALQAGAVDIAVRNGKGIPVTLKKGYTYLSEVSVDAFSPAHGPAQGGTQITVHGSGFLPGDRILVGWAPAMDSEVLDPNTLVGIVPATTLPATVDLLPVPVAVRHASGVAVAASTFTYGRAPHLAWVDPPVVPMQGAAVTVHGEGLGNVQALYARGAQALLSPGTAGSVRGTTLPAATALDPQAQPGPADLLATGDYGAHHLNPAFVYSGPVQTPQLFGVTPASGDAGGGDQVVLLLALPAGAALQSATFGGTPTLCTQGPTAVTCKTPTHAAGPVTVAIQTSAGPVQKDHAFTFVGPLGLEKLVPDVGPTAGGTQVSVRGSGLTEDCAVRIGLYEAQVQGAGADKKTLTIQTPPGPAGPVDVQVTCQGVTVALPGGYGYTDGKVHIDAVVPSSGATGGGTPVQIHGSGFQKGMQILFAGKPATALTVKSSGLVEVKTPPHEAGPVTVDVVQGPLGDTLLDGFTYTNPTSPHGGTAGEQALGTLNVTVLDIYTLEPIEEAFVQVGQPGAPDFPKFNGTTDANGQIVFAGNGLVAPITVSATKEQYSASSIVSFDARNATLLLFPLSPPSQGGGGTSPPPLPLATLRGKVLDVDKYLQVPPTNCLKSGSFGTGDLTCNECSNDSQCAGTSQSGATYRCVDNGIAGKRCLPVCTAKDICTKGTACEIATDLKDVKVCKPQLGIRTILCATSIRSWDAEDDNPVPSAKPAKGPGALPWASSKVDEKTGEFEISARLDELAIECIGGYVDNKSQAFQPTAMGVRRHVFPQPLTFDDKKGGPFPQNHLDIKLDIPLKRALPVRLDHPQHFFQGKGGALRVTPWIDLGSDGLIHLPRFEVDVPLGADGKPNGTGVTDDVTLPFLPLQLPEALSETSYVYYARAEFGSPDQPPITATLHPDVKAPGDANVRVRTLDGLSSDQAIGVAQELSAVLTGESGSVLLVAKNGRLYRGPIEGPSLVYVPVVTDPYAVPVPMLAAAGTPTDATIVGENGLIRRLLGTKVTVESGALQTTLRGVCVGPQGRVAVGDSGGIEVDRGQGWQVVTVATALPLRAVLCTDDGALAVGDQGTLVTVDLGPEGANAQVQTVGSATLRAIVRDGQGTLWIAGDKLAGQGPVLLKRDAQGAWQDGWPAGTLTPTIPSLRTLVAVPDALLIVDVEGGVRRLDAAGVHDESPERRDLRPTAGIALPDGRAVLVGEPGLWLGPFLTIPEIAKPDSLLKSGPVPVEWSVAPGPDGSFTRVHLDGSGFPFWWLYVAPTTTSLTLPDFESLAGIQVFINNPQIAYVVHVDRGFVPGFSINGFGTFDLEFDTWRSWAKNAKSLVK